MNRHFRILGLAGLLGLMACPLFGQGRVNVTGANQSGSNLTFTLQNTATIPPTGLSASFRMQGSPTLGPGTWVPTGAGPFTEVAGSPGFYTTTFTRPGVTRYFYRFLGIAATPGDQDGDGLTDTLEDTNYGPSAKTFFDSDSDGFSDGEEFAYGTDPLNGSSKPVFVTHIPTVNFILADTTATEGAGTHQVQIRFDRDYSGTVNYAINTLSNTVAGVDYAPVTGSLTMNTNSAFIPITPIDDASVSGQRVVIIDLTINGNNYFIGGRGSHVVLLKDNDSWWTGTLVPASGEVSGRSFRVKVAHQQGGAVTAVFGAGAGNDGLPVPVVTAGGGAPAIGATSVSTAMFPAGTYPGTGAVDSAVQFHVDSPVVAIGAGSICNQPIRRQVVLNAQPSLNSATHAHSLLPGIRYVGDYTETLTTTTGATLAILPGSFILMRDIPAPLPVLSKLVP